MSRESGVFFFFFPFSFEFSECEESFQRKGKHSEVVMGSQARPHHYPLYHLCGPN